MMPIHLHLKPGQSEEDAIAELGKQVEEMAKSLNLSEDKQAAVRKGVAEAVAALRRDGAGNTTARSLIEMLKEAEQKMDGVDDIALGLAKMTRSSAQVFAMGSIGADLKTAAMLLQHSRYSLRELIDDDAWKREPKQQATATPASAE